MANTKYHGLWSLVSDSLDALAKNYIPVLLGKATTLQLTERGGRPLLGLSTNFQLNGLTLADIMQREAYWPELRLRGLFAGLQENGWIEDADGKYTFTNKANDVIAQLNVASYDYLATLDVMSDTEIKTLLSLLKRILDTAKTLPYAHSLRLQPMNRAHSQHLLGQVNEYLNGLNALRDDSHLATWRDEGISGHAWETLTFYWRDEDYSEFMQFRNFTDDEHQSTLDTLRERGWLEKNGDDHTISDAARHIRDDAEAQTDVNFYAAWGVLSDEEVAAVRRLLTKLKVRLEAIAAGA